MVKKYVYVEKSASKLHNTLKITKDLTPTRRYTLRTSSCHRHRGLTRIHWGQPADCICQCQQKSWYLQLGQLVQEHRWHRGPHIQHRGQQWRTERKGQHMGRLVRKGQHMGLEQRKGQHMDRLVRRDQHIPQLGQHCQSI